MLAISQPNILIFMTKGVVTREQCIFLTKYIGM